MLTIYDQEYMNNRYQFTFSENHLVILPIVFNVQDHNLHMVSSLGKNSSSSSNLVSAVLVTSQLENSLTYPSSKVIAIKQLKCVTLKSDNYFS